MELDELERKMAYLYFMNWVEFLHQNKMLTAQMDGDTIFYEVNSTYCERFFSVTVDKIGVPVLGIYDAPQTKFFKHIEWPKLYIHKTIPQYVKKRDYILLKMVFLNTSSQEPSQEHNSIYLKLPISREITPIFDTFDTIYLGSFEVIEKEVIFSRKIIKRIKREYLNESSNHVIW